MITLDPTLATAQDSLERQPIVNINSVSFVDSIPFEGQAFNTSTLNERNPDIIEMSSGRLAAVIERNSDLLLLITDTNKTEWSEYTIYNPGSVSMLIGSIVELSDNNLGIVLIDKPSDYYLRRLVVNTSGAIVTAVSTIMSTSNWIDSPSVQLLANGTYFLTYNYKDGSNNYYIQRRTSSDFLSWAGAVSIPTSGLDITKRIDNVNIHQLATGDIFLLFDYQDDIQGDQELVNVYAMQSDDNGATWTTPTKLTNYTVYGTVGRQPAIAERDDGSVEIAFQEEKDILKMNTSTPGWDSNLPNTSDMYYNPTTNKLYTHQIYTSAGTKYLSGVTIIDVATWTVDKSYTTASTPSINQKWRDNHVWYQRHHDEGKYSVTGLLSGDSVMVINIDADTITYYNFVADGAYQLVKNISHPANADPWAYFGYSQLDFQVDEDSDRLYILYKGTNSVQRIIHFKIGYIDLLEQPDIITGNYTFNLIGSATANHGNWTDWGNMVIDVPNNLIMAASVPGAYSHGNLVVLTLEPTALLKNYLWTTTPGFHPSGCYDPEYINGHIYAGIEYQPLYGAENYYGLMDIDLATDSIQYHRPSYATANEYGLKDKKAISDNRILINGSHGVSIFDIDTVGWTLYDSNTVPGFPGNGLAVDYDEEEDMLFMGSTSGVCAFPEEGNFQQLQYITGTYDAGWSYGSAEILAEQFTNSQPTLVVDSENILWALWTHRDITEYSTYWDQELAEKDLTNYLTNDPITVNWDIESPASLNFSLSNGHLFDPSNSMSTIAPFVKKGRKIELQFGETVSGSDYLQNQGFFIVNDISLSYSRGSYPTISISCEDPRIVWRQAKIPASDYFSNEYPEPIVTTLLEEYASVASIDIDIPTFIGRHTLYHQFIDQYLTEMLTPILDHFNYFFYITMDGKYTARQIDLSGSSVDHIYSGSELQKYTPDDSFSNFLNRIIVKGEGRYELEVIYSSEITRTIAGTVGWWGGKEIKRVYYSDDRQKRCRSPYLDVKTSIKEFSIFTLKGGGSEYISSVDPSEYYVEITIEAPDLVAVFIGIAASILAIGTAALSCGATNPCGPYIYALTILVQIMGYLLGSIAQYEYDIWASPIGQTKQTFQAQANDLVLQRQLNGLVVSDEIDDPFCYTINSCQTVADNALAITMAQRNRKKFSKIAHLQDEIGDTLQIKHPYTELDIKIFLVGLTRTYQKGSGIIDSIEGWQI